MASLKEVRIRIASVNSTKQITSAMKMVSASKLRKAQSSLIKLRPYAAKMSEMMKNLCGSESIDNLEYLKERKVEKILVIVVASNRGLCGAFNTNIIKTAQNFIAEKFNEQLKQGNVNLICIGKKVSEYFVKHKDYNVTATDNDILDSISYAAASEMAESIMNDFAKAKYDRVFVIYNQFKNAAAQIIRTVQFLPMVSPATSENSRMADYILEPDKQQVVKELVPRSLKLQLYEYILNSVVSEHGARMTAMHKATDNATELLKELRLSYNKVRQASITNEILEIVGGADALS